MPQFKRLKFGILPFSQSFCALTQREVGHYFETILTNTYWHQFFMYVGANLPNPNTPPSTDSHSAAGLGLTLRYPHGPAVTPRTSLSARKAATSSPNAVRTPKVSGGRSPAAAASLLPASGHPSVTGCLRWTAMLMAAASLSNSTPNTGSPGSNKFWTGFQAW